MRESAENETIVFVVDHRSVEREPAALGGRRMMEVIRDWGVDVAAACGSAGLCEPERP